MTGETLKLITDCNSSFTQYLLCQNVNVYEYGTGILFGIISGMIGAWFTIIHDDDSNLISKILFGAVGGAFIGIFIVEALSSTLQDVSYTWLLIFLLAPIGQKFFERLFKSGVLVTDGLFGMIDRVFEALFKTSEKKAIQDMDTIKDEQSNTPFVPPEEEKKPNPIA